MMLTKKLFPIFLLACSILACTNTPKQESNSNEASAQSRFATPKIEASFKAVMVVHDEVMPFISSMKRDKKQLAEHKKTLQDAQEIEAVDLAINLLTEGDSLMFAWMKNFKTPGPASTEAEALPYLAQEQEKIEVVNTRMKEAIQKAEALLSKIPE